MNARFVGRSQGCGPKAPARNVRTRAGRSGHVIEQWVLAVREFREYVRMAALGRTPNFASERYNKCCHSMSYVYDYHILCPRPERWVCSALLMAVSSAVATLLTSHPRIAQVGPQAPPAPSASLRAKRAPLRGRGPPMDYLDNPLPASIAGQHPHAVKKVRI